MSSFIYNVAKARLAGGDLPWGTATLKVMLITTGYTGNADDANMDLAAAVEINGTGYTAGPGSTDRKTLASPTVTQDDVNNVAKLDANDPAAWSGLSTGESVVAAVVYQHVSDSDDTLNFPIAYLDDGGFPIADPVGNLSIVWNASGVAQVS